MADPADSKPTPLTNEDWLAVLRDGGPTQDRALTDLMTRLRRSLRRVLGDRAAPGDVDDLVQDSLGRILANLDSFRGDSAFTTWATAIAMRVAFTELRRRSARGARGERLLAEVREEALALAVLPEPGPPELVAREQLVTALRRAIAEELTERQRLAIVAELRGLPTIAIAEQLGTNQNALYKLVHDARLRLRKALRRAGFDDQALRSRDEEIER